jgi:hypothetical protein
MIEKMRKSLRQRIISSLLGPVLCPLILIFVLTYSSQCDEKITQKDAPDDADLAISQSVEDLQAIKPHCLEGEYGGFSYDFLMGRTPDLPATPFYQGIDQNARSIQLSASAYTSASTWTSEEGANNNFIRAL